MSVTTGTGAGVQRNNTSSARHLSDTDAILGDTRVRPSLRPNASSEPTKPPRQLTTQAGSGITCASGSRRSHTTIYSSCHAAGSANTSHCSTNRRSAASMATPQTAANTGPSRRLERHLVAVGREGDRHGVADPQQKSDRQIWQVLQSQCGSPEPPADRRSDHFSGRYQHRTRGHQRKRWVHDHELHFQREWHQHRVLCFGQVVWHRQRRCSVDLRGLGAHLGQPAWLLRRRGRAHLVRGLQLDELPAPGAGSQLQHFGRLSSLETTDGLSETQCMFWVGLLLNASSAITSRRQQKPSVVHNAPAHPDLSAGDCCPIRRTHMGGRILGRRRSGSRTVATAKRDWRCYGRMEYDSMGPSDSWAAGSLSIWDNENWLEDDPTTWDTHQMWVTNCWRQVARLAVESVHEPTHKPLHIMQTSKDW